MCNELAPTAPGWERSMGGERMPEWNGSAEKGKSDLHNASRKPSSTGRPRTRWPEAHQVGFLVADERFFHRVQFQFSPQDPGDGCGMGGDVRAPHHVGIGGRRAP